MKIKKDVAPPISGKGRYSTKYAELRKAIEEMPMDSWIEVCFDEPVAIKHRGVIYVMPGNRIDFRLVTTKVEEYTMKIGKFPIEKE